MLESSTNRLEFSAISREIFRDKIFNTAGFEFRGQFPYLDKLQYAGFIQWVESQSDYQKFTIQCLVFNKYIYLTVIPRTRVGYELLDSGRGAKHRVGYHKLISNKREWNNCFIKYQTLDKIFRTIFSTDSSFRPFCGKIFCDKNVSFHIWTNYSIQDLYRE